MALDLQTYLDPTYKNAELRAYAFISSQFRRGARNSIECLLPFVIFAVAQQEGEVFAPEKIKAFVNARYFIDLPYFLIEDMRPTLEKLGALHFDQITKRLICQDARPTTDTELDDEMSEDLIDQVSRQLSSFAELQGLREPLSGASWAEVLIHFFSPTAGDRQYKRNVIKDRAIISSPIQIDNRVVASFITQQHDTGSRLYNIIEKIYYGVLVTDFLTKIASSGTSTAVRPGLQIVYDAPVLMRILGFCGKLLQNAALEMHNALRELGCETYYFSHSHTELLNNVEYIISARREGYPVKPETEEALRKGELSIADLASFKAAPDATLYNPYRITEHPASYEDRTGDQFQIDEGAFKAKLLGPGGRWGTTDQAAENDAASLALVLRLRKGKSNTDLWKSGVVFVTHNAGLVGRVRQFLKEEGMLPARTLSPFQTMSQVTTIAWLAGNTGFHPDKINSKLIADCYTAAVPDEGWNQELLNKVAQYDKDELQAMLDDAIFANSVREIATRQTLSNTAILRSSNAAALIRDAKEYTQKIKDVVREEGMTEGRLAAETELEGRAILVAKRLSDACATVIVIFAVLICATILITTGLGIAIPLVPRRSTIVLVMAAGLIAWSTLQLFGFSKNFSPSTYVSRLIFPGVRRVQRGLTGSPE